MTRREVVVALALTLVVAVAVPSALVLALLGDRTAAPGAAPAAPAEPDDPDLVPAPVVVGEAPPVEPRRVPDGVVLSGRARGVQLDGGRLVTRDPVTWESAELYGDVLSTDVRDAAGRPVGAGSVTAAGRLVLRSAGRMTLESEGTLLVRPDGVVVRPTSTGSTVLVALSGEGLRLTGDLVLTREAGPAVAVRGGTAVLDASQVTVSGADVLRWPSPRQLSARGQGLLSMAAPGGSAVLPGGRRLAATHLGVAAAQLDVGLRRDGRAVVVSGRALRATQVYTDGAPRLRTTARVQLTAPPPPIDRARGREQRFTWAPENTGDADMLMTRIRPVGPEAAWVELALAPGPAVFGGEDRPPVGGDTRGLDPGDTSCFFCSGAKEIRALLPPGDADSRDITVSPPAGVRPGRYVVRLRVEGNFPAVDVRVPVEVV